MLQKKIKKPEFVLLFDCISRYLMLGESFHRELELITGSFDRDVPLLGALTFGEVGCHIDIPLYHNKTVALVTGGSLSAGDQ
ncbi:MAG: FIST C-terminal domain-containing protein [Candidatus Xenobiia bacterium LiM19]